jgi:hypothetical protein
MQKTQETYILTEVFGLDVDRRDCRKSDALELALDQVESEVDSFDGFLRVESGNIWTVGSLVMHRPVAD